MRIRTLAIAMLALTPALLPAQRNRRGGGDASLGAAARPTGPAMAKPGDFEKHSPARVLLDKKKKLSLTDSQVVQLTVIAAKVKDENAPRLKQLESVQKSVGRVLNVESMSDEDREKYNQRRNEMAVLMAAIGESDDAGLQSALALFNDEQKKEAEEILKEDREDLRETLRRRAEADSKSLIPEKKGRP